MIDIWLKEEKRLKTNYSEFAVIDLTENDLCEEELKELKTFLANQILIHLDYPDRLKRIFKEEPVDKLRNHVLNLTLPDKDAPFNPEQSFFGEIVTAEILQKIRRANLPCYKLRSCVFG